MLFVFEILDGVIDVRNQSLQRCAGPYSHTERVKAIKTLQIFISG